MGDDDGFQDASGLSHQINEGAEPLLPAAATMSPTQATLLDKSPSYMGSSFGQQHLPHSAKHAFDQKAGQPYEINYD